MHWAEGKEQIKDKLKLGLVYNNATTNYGDLGCIPKSSLPDYPSLDLNRIFKRIYTAFLGWSNCYLMAFPEDLCEAGDV